MLTEIKEICIFMIIAQTILFFVPGTSYMKYVRVLVGIIIILRMMEPVFGLVMDEEKSREILERMAVLKGEISREEKAFEVEDYTGEIYQEIEEELRSRLEKCDDSYEVTDVSIEKEGSGIVITLRQNTGRIQQETIRVEPVRIGEDAEQELQKEEKEIRELKNRYGSCIGVEAEKLTIIFQ